MSLLGTVFYDNNPLCNRLLRAAVSRQAERLLDAAAVATA
jgi:hypothetical protein